MKAHIDIDDELMQAARRVTGLETDRAVVEAALRLLVRLNAQEKMRELHGQIDWQGDLNELRRNRFPED